MLEHMCKSDAKVLVPLPFTTDSMDYLFWQAQAGCIYYQLASLKTHSISLHVNRYNNGSQNLGHHAGSVPAAVDKLLSMHFSLLINSTIQSWQQGRHATLSHWLVVLKLRLYLKHEIGSGEVNGTSCATGRLQSNDFEVSQVYS